MICKRCGWKCDAPAPQWMEGDEGRLIKLPAELASPHPAGQCNSPFIVDQPLYWNMDLAVPDLPPLRVFFKEIVEFESAVFTFQGNDWVKESEAKPSVVSVLVDMRAVYPEHEEIYGRELLENPIEVRVDSLTSVETWPVLEVD